MASAEDQLLVTSVLDQALIGADRIRTDWLKRHDRRVCIFAGNVEMLATEHANHAQALLHDLAPGLLFARYEPDQLPVLVWTKSVSLVTQAQQFLLPNWIAVSRHEPALIIQSSTLVLALSTELLTRHAWLIDAYKADVARELSRATGDDKRDFELEVRHYSKVLA